LRSLVDTKGTTLEEIASFPGEVGKASEPEPEPTAGELFDGNIAKLGRFVEMSR